MNVDHGNCSLETVDNSQNQEFSNHEKFTYLLTKYVSNAAPHQFALCREYCQDNEDWVFMWGVAFVDSVLVFHPNGKLVGTFTSPEAALSLFSRAYDLSLVWIDPTMCAAKNARTTA
jgi:hypothetical protein